ncbi:MULTISPECIES: TolC family protein [unclassified Psychrobacter]|uniref:TolC family protein n=1 Tax=unclassified Psychrobacter TaxID=196806 RepID=UPI0017880CAF|nr:MULTISPECIES: TolC family protein [unclassified Psychrobacter]MBE0442415.1 TolC family protein [Psychrobacter sp. FME13]
MKFALSTLSNSVMMFTLMALAASNLASANENDIESPNQVTPINDADNQSNIQKSYAKNKTIATNSEIEISQQQPNLKTLVDPTTHKNIDSSYSLEVPSLLSLEQAQNILLQVSPKLAANQAAIASSEYQTDALDTLDNPLVFARVSATAYNLDTDLDLSSLKSGVVNEADSLAPYFPNLPNLGELADERIPDSYELKRSGSTSGAGVGVLWPIYTAGRTTALTSASEARTQEAIADSLLDKNELYNTLIERYFKAQLAIIAAYLREDAYDTLQQTDHMAQRLFEEGFISRVDRLEAQSALADAKSESVNANNDARLAMMALQRLLRTEYRIKPTTPLFVSSRPLPDVTYFQDLALANHPGLQKVAAKRKQAEQLHALSDTGYKPTVMLYGYGQVEKDPSWVAGISASWKLWGGLDKTASLASSNAKIRQADLSEIEVSDNLLLLVEKNWHDVNNAQSRYQALQSNVDLAAEVLRLRQLGLQEGVNTPIEVVQAQTQSLKARTEQAQAANSYVQSLAALMQSCGTPLAFNTYLNAADIQLPTLYTE